MVLTLFLFIVCHRLPFPSLSWFLVLNRRTDLSVKKPIWNQYMALPLITRRNSQGQKIHFFWGFLMGRCNIFYLFGNSSDYIHVYTHIIFQHYHVGTFDVNSKIPGDFFLSVYLKPKQYTLHRAFQNRKIGPWTFFCV